MAIIRMDGVVEHVAEQPIWLVDPLCGRVIIMPTMTYGNHTS